MPKEDQAGDEQASERCGARRQTQSNVVDPRTDTNKPLVERFSGVEESQEEARQEGQRQLLGLIKFSLIFAALFDASLLIPGIYHPDTKIILCVNGAFLGSSGILGFCVAYILAPYRDSQRKVGLGSY